jgi:opacity protein-like surface antigen
MKKLYKAALLAALGLGSITAAQASTDLLLGFNDAAGPTSAQNDYVIDLGLSGATLVADAIANNGTYDLSSLFNSSTFTTAFGSDSSALNNVNVGVVGGYSISNPKLLYQTVAAGVTPAALSGSELSNGANIAQGITIGEYASTTGAGWTASVAVNATTLNSQNFPSTIANATGISPLGNLSSGVLSIELWENQRNGISSPAGWVDQGTFNINLNTDTITFITPVPEPSTLGLMGGAGLAALPLCRRFTRKNA